MTERPVERAAKSRSLAALGMTIDFVLAEISVVLALASVDCDFFCGSFPPEVR